MRETATEFAERLASGDRWIELVDGALVRLSPPDELHGNVVRNVAQRLAKQARAGHGWFPCYELGLIVAGDRQNVRCPALSLFPLKVGVELSTELVTDERPSLIVEVASSNDRREQMSERIRRYELWEVPAIWVFDPQSRHAHIFHQGQRPRMLKETEFLRHAPILPDLEFLVGDMFLDPAWAMR
jgi:Uma2 family endonuclease